jgi:hypothetical protein
MSEPMGDLLNSLGLDLDLDDDELVAGALVLLKTVDADGEVGLRIRWSDGMGYIERLGMMVAGQSIETSNLGNGYEDE